MVEFVNRSEELDRLYDLFGSGSADLAVVYGRRRLGKTRLVKKALEGREDAVFYQARRRHKNSNESSSSRLQLTRSPASKTFVPIGSGCSDIWPTGMQSSSSTSFRI